VYDHAYTSRLGYFAVVNAEAEICVDLALICQDSADSRPIEWELADGRDGCHRAQLPAARVEAHLRDHIEGQ
jgi:hypothetical protein